MRYSTNTRSKTPPGRYQVHQTLSHWKNRQKTNRRQKTEPKPCHALSSSQPTILLLMPLEASSIGLSLNLVVECAVGFNCVDFLSAAPPKETHSPVASWLVLDWRTVSKVLLQQAGASLISIRSLSVPIMGCAVGVTHAISCCTWCIEIGDAPQWRC